MITDISLFVIFSCFCFVTLCSRIHVRWVAKGIMCVGMLAIIGKLSDPNNSDMLLDIIMVVLAYMIFHGTTVAYKRGSYK